MADNYPGVSLAQVRRAVARVGLGEVEDRLLRRAIGEAEDRIAGAISVPPGISLFTHCGGAAGALASEAVVLLAAFQLAQPQAAMLGLPWPERVVAICERLRAER